MTMLKYHAGRVEGSINVRNMAPGQCGILLNDTPCCRKGDIIRKDFHGASSLNNPEVTWSGTNIPDELMVTVLGPGSTVTITF